MYDIIIKNGFIVDGSGKEKYIGDIGISGDRIIEIGKIDSKQGRRIIDAKDKVVCPGFIDPHSHADESIIFYTGNQSCIMQGVTSFVGGNCGGSGAPMGEYWDTKFTDLEKVEGVIPSYYTWYNGKLKREDAEKQIKEVYDIDLDYNTLEEFCKTLERLKISTNYYPLIGHGNIREVVMKGNVNREATPKETEQMKVLLEEALKTGARGMSTGLDYPPGAYASTEEIIELAKVLKKYNGIYASHVRGRKLFTTGEGGYDPEGGIKEAFLIGEKTGVHVHISHVLTIKNPEYTKEIFEEARHRGIKVSFDVIANTTAGGGTFTYLAFILKPWYFTAGSPEQFVRNLNDPDYVEAMKKDMSCSKWYFANYGALPGVEEAILITRCTNNEYEGKTVASIMKEKNWSYADTLINIAKADPLTKIKYGAPSKEEEHEIVKELMSYPWAMPSSDGIAADNTAKFGFAAPLDFYPHQNSYNYAIRYLLRYSQESIEKTIRKATGLVAEIFNIKDRGIIAENKYADIVIYSPDKLECNESLLDTRMYPKGIDYVLVNGVITVQEGIYAGAKAGKILRS